MARFRVSQQTLVSSFALGLLILGSLGVVALMVGLPGQTAPSVLALRSHFLTGIFWLACVLSLMIAALRPARIEFLWFGAFAASITVRVVLSATEGAPVLPEPAALVIAEGLARAGSMVTALLFVLHVVDRPLDRGSAALIGGVVAAAAGIALTPYAAVFGAAMNVLALCEVLLVLSLLIGAARRGVDGASALLFSTFVMGGAAILRIVMDKPDMGSAPIQVMALLVGAVSATGALLLRLSDGSDWFSVLATHARDAIVVATQKGEVVEANAAWDALLGQPKGRRSVRDAVSAEDRALAEAHLGGVEEGRRAELRLKNAQGGEVFTESVAVSLPEDRVLLVMRDITSRRQLESSVIRAARLETAGILAGGIAHDVNNAMTAMMAHLEMMRSGVDERGLKRLDRMETIIKRTAVMTRRLVTTMRGDGGTRSVLSVDEPLRSATELARSTLPPGVNLELRIEPGLAQVHGSADELEQAIINLLLNARDAVAEQGGTIRVSAATSESGTGVVLAVEDDGPGVPEALRARIFEPFYTTKGAGRGTGLGLSVVARAVRDHGGAISLGTGRDGRGARFEITLPASTATPTLTMGIEAPHARVLAVDDDPDILEMMRAELLARGCEVITAADAEAAERCFDEETGRFDLLVTDVMLPGMSGIALAQRLCARRPGLAVLVVSGFIPEDEPGLDSRWGRLDKPFSADRLGGAVRRTMLRALRDSAPG